MCDPRNGACKIKFLVIIILSAQIIFIQQLHCQTTGRITLDSAINILDAQNVEVQLSKLNAELAEQDYRDAKNALLPTISAGVGGYYNYGVAFDQIAGHLITGNRWTNSGSGSVNAQLNIFDGFRQRNNIKEQRYNHQKSALDIEITRRSIRLNFVALYFNAMTNHAIYKASLEQLAYSTEQLALIRDQFDVGTKTLVDISLAENQVTTDELNTLNSKNAYENTLLEIKQLLNIPLKDSLEIVEPVFDSTYRVTDSINIIRSVDRDPSVLAAEILLEQSFLTLKTAKYSTLPKLALSTGYGSSYSSERTDMFTGNYMPFWDQASQNKALNIGFNLSIPILNGFMKRSAINRSKINILQRQKEKEKVSMEQERSRLTANQDLQTAFKEYYGANVQLRTLKKTLDAMSERFHIGVASSTEFSKALLDYNQSEFNLIRARYMLMYRNKVIDLLTDY